jgi:hypothetical protein
MGKVRVFSGVIQWVIPEEIYTPIMEGISDIHRVSGEP